MSEEKAKNWILVQRPLMAHGMMYASKLFATIGSGTNDPISKGFATGLQQVSILFYKWNSQV